MSWIATRSLVGIINYYTAIFPKGVPVTIDFGVSTKSVSPVFATLENTLPTHKKNIYVSLV